MIYSRLLLILFSYTFTCCFSILLLINQCNVIKGDEDDSLWSLRIGNYDLINIPKLNFNFDFGFNKQSKELPTAAVTVTTEPAEPDIELRPLFINPDINEDANLKTPNLLKKYGYPAEIHNVITDDGYILEIHRISRPNSKPVILTHGLLDSSATWILMGPDKGLGYLLYDQGYDVWMTNVRGNTYSRKHIKYNAKQAIFWDFSFHEMGKYDMPAVIDYVLENTNQSKLHYIGHSQGTTIFWIMCIERPEYNDKIILMQALAPVAFLKHAKSPVVEFLAVFQEPLGILLQLIGAHEFLPSNEFLKMFNQLICDEDIITEAICTNVIFLVVGFDSKQINETMLPVALGHTPAGASTKQMQHFAQLKNSGHFRQYDYGWLRNHWRYNTLTPPDYNLKNIYCRIALHYAQNDWLSSSEDVEKLHENLPNVLGKFKVNYPDFNHLDFVWGIDARELLYNKITQLMDIVEKGYF